MHVSVIIPTLNRKESLVKTILDLDKQIQKDMEILVVDQSDPPVCGRDIPPVHAPLHIHAVSEKNLPNARNVGAEIARGSILLFLDDDIEILSQDFISNHLRHFEDESVGLVTGRVIQPWNVLGAMTQKAGTISNNLLIVKGGFNSPEKQWVHGIAGGNFSCRRQIFSELGGFDKNFIGTSLFEETDFSIRARKKGWKILYDPQAALKHLSNSSGGVRSLYPEKISWFYWYFHNSVLLFCKHGRQTLFPCFLIYLLLRGLFYVLKYGNIRFLTEACFRGIRDGIVWSKRTQRI